MATKWKEIKKEFREHFRTKYDPVGVKLLKERPDNVIETNDPLRYCQYVKKAAMLGEKFILDDKSFSCPNCLFTLGFKEPVYGDIEPRIKPANTKAIMIAPLGDIEDPDVILTILTPIQVMEISRVIYKDKNESMVACFKGERAVCGEATAKPYMENGINVTMLCQGARLFGPYSEKEMVMGFKTEKFLDMMQRKQEIEEIGKGLCGCIVDDVPSGAIDKLEKIGFEKGTDYFFGYVEDNLIRIYLNKDEHGEFNKITLHLPLKLNGDINRVLDILSSEYMVNHQVRDNWLDLSIVLNAKDESINMHTGQGIEIIKDYANKLIEIGNRIKRVV
ncbi:MAG: DUF169 domain-containing protein [Candidatus Hydrothermarchaeota archaeon]